MPRFARALGKSISALTAVAFPMFRRGSDKVRFGGPVFWILHIVSTLAILVALAVINRRYFLRNLSDELPFVQSCWLPLLYLCLYGLTWVIAALLDALRAEPSPAEHLDIDGAWSEATSALAEAGIDLADTPIFLVMGLPTAGEGGMFLASGRDLILEGVPSRPAPIHVYASRDEIYVACGATSMLGRQSEMLREAAPTGGARKDRWDQHVTICGDSIENFQKVMDFIREIRSEGRELHQLTPDEERRFQEIFARTSVPRSEVRRLHGSPAELNGVRSRFEHLCRLIERDRRPFCPLNGAIALIPMVATNNTDGAVGECLRDDLSIIRGVTRLRFPVLALVVDLESLRGYSEFVGAMPEAQLSNRLGVRFPYAPDPLFEKFDSMVARGVDWLSERLFPSMVWSSTRLDLPSVGRFTNVGKFNSGLVGFLIDVSLRVRLLGKILNRGFSDRTDSPPMLGGIYLAGTGASPFREQTFLEGVFARPSEDQDLVSWEAEALAAERSAARTIALGYGLIGAIAAAVVAGLFLWFRDRLV